MKSIYRKYYTTVVLIWTICFVLFLFAYMLLLAPQRKSKKQIRIQLIEKKRMYDSAQKAAQKETQDRLNEQIEILQSKLRDFVFDDSANLVFDIGQIAEHSEIDPPPSIKGKDKRGNSTMPDCDYMSENQVAISFSAASFNQFAFLLNALERHKPIVFVDGFTITRSEQEDSGHEVSMDLAVFVKKRQES